MSLFGGQKNNYFLYFFVVALFSSPLVHSSQTNSSSLQKLYVFDQRPGEKGLNDFSTPMPNNFRSASQDISDSSVDKTGIEKLRISGSNQFTAAQLKAILSNVRVQPADFLIVDLRQERHFFIDGLPFALSVPLSTETGFITDEQILREEEQIVESLVKSQPLLIHRVIEKGPDETIIKSEAQEIPADKIMTEKTLSNQLGVGYVRLGVQDHCSPDDATVDKFVQLITSEKRWIHVHCRGGKGRTSTFMLMYDILKNHKDLSLEKLMARQVALGSKNLESTEKSSPFETAEAEKRLNFIQRFYKYVCASDGYGHQTWQEWSKKNPT